MSLNPFTRSGPISPKAHGAWLGASTGLIVANIVIGLLQTYVLHKSMPMALQQLIDWGCTSAVAFLGAWLAPLIAKITGGAVTVSGTSGNVSSPTVTITKPAI